MPNKPKAHNTLVSPKLVSWRQLVVSNIELGTATDYYPLWRAPFKCRIAEATYGQLADADGTQYVYIYNATKTEQLTAQLDVDALGALEGDDFVISDPEHVIEEGDFLELYHNYGGGATTGPGYVGIAIDVERLDDE